MSLAAPLALLGLLALPLVWWLHKKLRTPPEIVLPSLMFLLDEDDASKLPRGRRLDAELLLALTATALLAFAAAGPSLVRSKPRRVVRVIVSGGAPANMTGYADAVRRATADVRAVLAPEDDLQVRWVPAAQGSAPRPTDAALLAAALADEASARLVVSDRAPSVATGAVRWIAVGTPGAHNTGIIAVSAERTEAGHSLFCTVAHHGSEPARGRIELVGAGGRPFEIAAGGVATFSFPLDAAPVELRLRARDGTPWKDVLQADDRVLLRRHARRILLDPDLPDALIRAVTAAERAVAGPPDGSAQDAPPALRVTRRGAAGAGFDGWVLELEPVSQGAPLERAPAGVDAVGAEPLVADLSTAGADWVYAAGAADVRADERVLLARHAGGRLWPVLLVRGRTVRLAPDPLRGEPRAVDTPFWPLLIDNLFDVAVGRGIGAGLHAGGLLDPASSKPGDARIPLPAAALASAPPSVPGRDRPLRPLLICGALACLVLLWASPRIRRRLTPKPALAVPASP